VTAHRYFYDCEFIEDGRLIDLVSIGVVDEHGGSTTRLDRVRRFPRRTLGAPARAGEASVAGRQGLALARADPRRAARVSGRAGTVRNGDRDRAVGVVCGVRPCRARPAVGCDADAAPGDSRFTKDLRQLWDEVGRPTLPMAQGRHDALVDARHNLARWSAMRPDRVGGIDPSSWPSRRPPRTPVRLQCAVKWPCRAGNVAKSGHFRLDCAFEAMSGEQQRTGRQD